MAAYFVPVYVMYGPRAGVPMPMTPICMQRGGMMPVAPEPLKSTMKELVHGKGKNLHKKKRVPVERHQQPRSGKTVEVGKTLQKLGELSVQISKLKQTSSVMEGIFNDEGLGFISQEIDDYIHIHFIIPIVYIYYTMQ